MPSTIVCPSCASKLNVPDELLGQTVACPKCNAQMSVGAGASARSSPSVSSAPPPMAPPEPPPRSRPRFDDDEDSWRDDDDRYASRFDADRRAEELKPGSGFGVTAMVLGIVGILTGLIFAVCCMPLGIPIPALAIIFGCLGLKREGRGMALAGLIMGIVTIVLLVLFTVVIFAIAGAHGKFR